MAKHPPIAGIDDLQRRVDGLAARAAAGDEACLAAMPEAFHELAVAIEELRAAQEDLARQNEVLGAERERYRDLFDFAPDGYVVTSAEGVIEEMNVAAADMLRLESRQAVGKPFVGYIAQEDHAGFMARMAEAAGVEAIRQWEIMLKPRRGDPFPASVDVAPVRGDDGRVVSLRWLLRNITERRRAREESDRLVRRLERYTRLLKRSRDRMEEGVARRTAELADANEALAAERRRLFSLLNMLPGFVLLHGADHRAHFANHKFLEIFGDPSGQPCYALMGGRDEPCAECRTARILQTGQWEEWEYTSPGGRSYRVWGYPFRDTDGTDLVLELGIDVTERRELEREILHISEDEQHRIGRDLHDVLGQNLAGIAFLSKVLSRRLAAEKRPESEQAAEIAALAGQAVTQTRAISRNLCPVELTEEGLWKALQCLAEHTEGLFGIPVRCKGGEGLSVNQPAVASHLYHIAQEAVHNATRHARPSRITIGLEESEEALRLVVEDDGVGLPGAADRGGGMGLRIMHYRADMIGGVLRVEPGRDKGTRITCTVPADRFQEGWSDDAHAT
jgi:PAS domain S-box-containing protein